MAPTTAHADSGSRAPGFAGKSLAQWFCLITGGVLVLAGVLGFIADASFDANLSGIDDQAAVNGDTLLGLEVNGWHNIVHILTGLLLLAASPKRASARAIALIFGLTYALVTLIGLIDGDDIFGILPINAPDNVLHLALALTGIVAALADRDLGGDRGRGEHREAGDRATVRGPDTGGARSRFMREGDTARDLDEHSRR